MREALLRYVLLLITTSLISCNPKTDWQANGLKGEVKSIIEEYHEAKMEFGEWTQGDIELKLKYRFDSIGNLLSEESISEYGRTTFKVVNDYKNGILIGSSYYDYEYDYGNLRNQKELIGKSKIINQTRNLREEDIYNESNQIIRKDRQYRKNNQIIKLIRFLYDSIEVKRVDTVFYKYNNEGHKIFRGFSSDDYKETLTFKYIDYDEQGNWTLGLIYIDEGNEPKTIQTRTYTYY